MVSTGPHSQRPTSNQTGRLVVLAFIMRLTVDTTMRMMYPYLPAISRGLGISLSQGGLLMAIRSAMIFPSPLFGLWSDRHGPRLLLTVALTAQGLGLWWLSSVQGLLAAIPPVILMGLSASAFIPVMQATISERVPFHRRGRVLAVVEFSWAITGLVILPLVGLLLVQRGWQAPLRVIAVLSLLVSPLPWLLPARRQLGAPIQQGLRSVSSTIWHNSSARAAILANGLIFVAAESFFVTYGAWLEQDFGLAPDEIGRVAALLGLAELSASGLSSLIIDRTGKRRGVGAGLLAMTVTLIALPILGRSLGPAIAAMFAFIMSFEFTIVSNIGLMSEQVPPARGTVLALGVMVGGIVRTLSDFLGLALFEWRGIEATVVYGAMGSALAALVMYRWVREPEDDINSSPPTTEIVTDS